MMYYHHPVALSSVSIYESPKGVKKRITEEENDSLKKPYMLHIMMDKSFHAQMILQMKMQQF